MREIRSSGSAEGVVSNHDPYSDSAFRANMHKKPRDELLNFVRLVFRS